MFPLCLCLTRASSAVPAAPPVRPPLQLHAQAYKMLARLAGVMMGQYRESYQVRYGGGTGIQHLGAHDIMFDVGMPNTSEHLIRHGTGM